MTYYVSVSKITRLTKRFYTRPGVRYVLEMYKTGFLFYRLSADDVLNKGGSDWSEFLANHRHRFWQIPAEMIIETNGADDKSVLLGEVFV